ncbi:MAG TPA: chalcone isomerase family protein [Candidatus Krumholzibacteria bacterium]|nr:chalcone isomerase family protein [Candidatus Krumholzibacteria bacterium]
MRRFAYLMVSALVLVSLAVPAAQAITESKTGVEYPDVLTVGCNGEQVELVATGAGLREKTILKVDVYTIASYMAKGSDLGADKGAGLVALKAPKQLQMNLRRSFSREKLINAFVEVIEKNYADTSPFKAEMAMFESYFTRDAQDGDVIIFDYCPKSGLTVMLNGEISGIIEKPAFAEALWSVWFGAKPASDGLKADLLKALN